MTQGCKWQEKSFNVAVIDRPLVICRKCNSETDGRYKHNGDILCPKCFMSLPSKPFVNGEIFSTHKDKAYEFTTDMFNGKPMQVNSKRQFKKLLRQYKMADASIKECHQEADFRKRINTEEANHKRKEFAKEIFYKNRKNLTFRRYN